MGDVVSDNIAVSDGILRSLPPLQGCLYCHAEDSTDLVAGRTLFGFGSQFLRIKCRQCGAVAQFDCDPDSPAQWRIRYRRFSRAARYFYVSIWLGKGGWLSADEATQISRNGYVQRMRVQQAEAGDFSWLQPPHDVSWAPSLFESPVILVLRAVSLTEAPSRLAFSRASSRLVIDSGKLFVASTHIHFLGQRTDRIFDFAQIAEVRYDDRSWSVVEADGPDSYQYRGVYLHDQIDPQLVAAVIEGLR